MSRWEPTMFRRALTTAASTIAVAALVAGCASSDADPGGEADPGPPTVRQQLVSFVVGAYATEEDVAEGECFADKVLSQITEDELVESDVLSLEKADGFVPRVPKRMASLWADAQFECTSYIKLASRAQAFATNNQLDLLTYSTCFGRRIGEARAKEATRAALVRNFESKAWRELRAAEAYCLAQSQVLG
jgi:hypothetical protein